MQHAAVVSPWVLPAAVGLNGTFFDLVGSSGLFAKFILLLLLVLSIVSWGVAIDKIRLYRRIEQQARSIRVEVRAMR